MSDAAYQQRVALGPEDRDRVQRLTDEVQVRLGQLVSIANQALTVPTTPAMVPRFVRGTSAGTDLPPFHWVEVYCDASGCTCVIFADDGQIFIERPCGTPGPGGD
jgi:hypothetical protein